MNQTIEDLKMEIEERSEKGVLKKEFQASKKTKKVKDRDGSCNVNEKEAKKFIMCNYTKKRDVNNGTKYPKCPH